MGKKRPTLATVGAVVALVLLAAACGSGPTTSGATRAEPTGRGGVYRTALTDFGFSDSFDPTGEYVALAWDFYGALIRTLVTYRHVAGSPGNELQPDLATEVPQPTDNGLTYTFKLKPNIKFGPPVNRAITSKDVAYAFQRINAAPLAAQYGFYYFGVIKGMDGQAKTAATKISGIETPDDQTITFRLTNPAGDFLNRLAMPATGAIPEEVAKCHTKAGDYGPYVIASGPYMIQGSDQLDVSSCDAQKPISGFDPSKKLYLVRNPNYDQATDTTRSNFIDGIKIDVDTNLDDIFNKVDRSELDGSLVDQPSKSILRRYQADSRKRQLIHVNAGDRTWYITMNTAVQPFDDVHVRKAVNYVIDKQGMLQAWGGQIAGDIATHIMPPTLLNGRLDSDYDPYATPGHRGDEGKARAEMRQSRYDKNKDGRCDDAVCSNLVMVNANVTPWTDAEPIAVQSLARIGLKVKPRALAMGAAYTTIQTVANKIPLALHPAWAKDYADPYTFAGALFTGSSIRATGNTNYSLVGLTRSQAASLEVPYPDGGTPNVDTDIDNCQRIPLTDPDRMDCWVRFDKKLMEQVVPWVPYLWSNVLTITAPTVTRYEFDQFSGQVSLTQIAVNNKATMD